MEMTAECSPGRLGCGGRSNHGIIATFRDYELICGVMTVEVKFRNEVMTVE